MPENPLKKSPILHSVDPQNLARGFSGSLAPPSNAPAFLLRNAWGIPDLFPKVGKSDPMNTPLHRNPHPPPHVLADTGKSTTRGVRMWQNEHGRRVSRFGILGLCIALVSACEAQRPCHIDYEVTSSWSDGFIATPSAKIHEHLTPSVYRMGVKPCV